MPEKIIGAERMSIVDKMNEINYPKGIMIIGDSANATAIRSMRNHGFNIVAVKKTPGKTLSGCLFLSYFQLKCSFYHLLSFDIITYRTAAS